ncbi:MAG: hypothetical protein ACREX3_23290 [Gammaproteobacteria bacterium]
MKPPGSRPADRHRRRLSGARGGRATFYRARRPVSVQQANVPRASSARALSAREQHTILEWLHAPAYADLSPRTVFALLLDAGRYLASVIGV